MIVERSTGGAIATLTMNRPNRRNALSEATVLELKKHLFDIESDSSVRVTIITGSAPGFCAGSDLKELATMDLKGMCAHEADTAQFCRSISQLRKPVIAAVDGFALGGGVGLALGCDIIISSPSCRWHLPEVKIGWIPPWGLELLAVRVGVVTARRLSWGGEPFSGTEAHRIGLVDYLSEDGAVLQLAGEIAQRLADLPDVAVMSVKTYFAPHVGRNGETGDVIANQMFEENCKHPVAIATLQKFGVRA